MRAKRWAFAPTFRFTNTQVTGLLQVVAYLEAISLPNSLTNFPRIVAVDCLPKGQLPRIIHSFDLNSSNCAVPHHDVGALQARMYIFDVHFATMTVQSVTVLLAYEYKLPCIAGGDMFYEALDAILKVHVKSQCPCTLGGCGRVSIFLRPLSGLDNVLPDNAGIVTMDDVVDMYEPAMVCVGHGADGLRVSKSELQTKFWVHYRFQGRAPATTATLGGDTDDEKRAGWPDEEASLVSALDALEDFENTVDFGAVSLEGERVGAAYDSTGEKAWLFLLFSNFVDIPWSAQTCSEGHNSILADAQEQLIRTLYFPPTEPHAATIPLFYSILAPAPALTSRKSFNSQSSSLHCSLSNGVASREGKTGDVISKEDDSEYTFWHRVDVQLLVLLQPIYRGSRQKLFAHLPMVTFWRLAEEPSEIQVVWDPVAEIHVKGIKTTLIVTPPALASQWMYELVLHAPMLKVLLYEGCWSKLKVPINAAQVEEERRRRIKANKKRKGAGPCLDPDEVPLAATSIEFAVSALKGNGLKYPSDAKAVMITRSDQTLVHPTERHPATALCRERRSSVLWCQHQHTLFHPGLCNGSISYSACSLDKSPDPASVELPVMQITE
ncbi:hypothetical protein BDZ89DRAFT_1134219 [Hymenopellis radicata]|nr:hypothetical protein BDZ89DRAFT_1134219 [Hymenopellis radicata]